MAMSMTRLTQQGHRLSQDRLVTHIQLCPLRLPARWISYARQPESADTTLEHDDNKVDDLGAKDQGDEAEMVPKTAAERRAAKGRKKRFRLTRNQTYHLMNEFARQTHPDGAHRQRLAREIPGLSARQVQVWFQNRRAKLKRLTGDHQKSTIGSRALDNHLDKTQSRQSAFSIQPPSMGTSMPVLGTGQHCGQNRNARPLDASHQLPHCRQHGQQYLSISGFSPASRAFALPPSRQAPSEHIPPTSNTLQLRRTYDQSRGPYIVLPAASYAGHVAQQQSQRLGRSADFCGGPTAEFSRTCIPYVSLDPTFSEHT